MSDVYELPGEAEPKLGEGGGSNVPPPSNILADQLNPIPSREGILCKPITTTTSPGFLDLPTGLICNCRHAGSSLNTVGKNLIGGHNLPSLVRIGFKCINQNSVGTNPKVPVHCNEM